MTRPNVAFIFARGGSRGVPRKNVRPIAGTPLIGHAIRSALAAERVDRVIVSTEDEEIMRVARDHGAEVPFRRPPELASDEAAEWLAWRHALAFVEEKSGPIGCFVSVPPTAPLRIPGDIDRCVEALEGDQGLDIVVTVTDSVGNPYYNMVHLDDRSRAALVVQPTSTVHRRQAAPPVFTLSTVAYAARPAFVRTSGGVFEGQVGAVHVPRERAIDIDDEIDFRLAELLFEQREE